ncbi:MAG TPA: hypothetical protein VLR94_09305 [Acidobacteriota bacterium]|nr:hypothetical protein [Acidobacteriota bacterium]
MSGIAGLLLIIYGALAGYVGWTDMQIHHLLTPTASYSTLGIGAALAVAGMGHFAAPHKSFLMAVPLLVYFHVQGYVDAMILYGDPKWLYQGCLIVVSAIILILSYRGYKAKQAAEAAQV